jgi:uncharacterized membrane protein YoaK (UPF0700 family)
MLATGALLATAGGFLDGFTYVGHGHVFANSMTGNVVLLGINSFSGSWTIAFHHLPAIVAFLAGVSAARALQLPSVRRKLTNVYLAALILEIFILAAVSMASPGVPEMLITTSIAFAASVQVGTFREVNGQSYSSTFTTGNLRTLGEAAFDWWFGGRSAQSASIMRDFALICFLFFVGAAAGGAVTTHFGNRSLWFEIALLAVVAIRVRGSKATTQ